MTLNGSLRKEGLRLFDCSPDLIRVWRVRLDTCLAEFASIEKNLSPDETERARRYHFDRDRRRFTVARGALRFILGGYLQQRPENIEFNYGGFGKPALAAPGSTLRFNVSHSHELALIGVAHAREVGLDVERLRPMPDQEQLLAANFSAREVAAFHSLPRHQWQAAFFAGWTRKEAYLKAQGRGLSIRLDSFSVSMEPDEPAALLEVRGDASEPARWRIVDLPVGPDYKGALVAEGKGWRFDCVDWNL